MRLIDADKLKDQIINEIGIIPTADMKDTVPSAISFVNRLNMAPTIDAVPVVRCLECKFLHLSSLEKWCWNENSICYAGRVTNNWYCADGKRKEDAK